MNIVSPRDTSSSDAVSSDADLKQRASKVVPGGMWGHQNVRALPEGYPQFFKSGEGARVTDADGRSYIDFMCSWGPNILGHCHPAVEKAAAERRMLGDCLDGPTEEMVVLAELLVETIPHADWAMFQKNGNDATTTCVTIARATTRKRKILVARGAYHGAVPWCSPSLAGVTEEDRAHILYYEFNDADSLAQAVEEAGDDLAAILVSSFRHDIGVTLEMPTKSFAEAARACCDKAGAALVLDDVRAGFRLHLGGSWERLGVRPDLAAWSKAIANGYPLAAVTGNHRFREGATKIFVTGSFWYGAVSFAAAIATIKELHRLDAPAYLERIGQRFRDGIARQAAAHGFDVIQSGPPQMPLIEFADDVDKKTGARFCLEALKRGVYLNHRHNMFLSTAHTEADIDQALEATDAAFAALADAR